MTYHHYVVGLQTPHLPMVSIGTPVFAVQLDQDRLELFQPNTRINKLQDAIFNVLRNTVADPKAEASDIINEAGNTPTLSIDAWRAEIVSRTREKIGAADKRGELRLLTSLLEEVKSMAERSQLQTNLTIQFLGVLLPSPIVRAKAAQYAAMRMHQVTAVISGPARITVPPEKQPATQHYKCCTTFYWNPMTSQPGDSGDIPLGLIVAIDFDNITINLVPVAPLFIST